MLKRWQCLLEEIQKLRVLNEKSTDSSEEELWDLGVAIKQAQKEWKEAKTMLNYVSDPDLIDYVIHTLIAAEKKYMYLIKKAKMDGYRAFKHDMKNQGREDRRLNQTR